MLNFLRNPVVILASFIITLALVFGFSAWVPSVGGEILDRIADQNDARDLLAEMSTAQKRSHFWMTLLLDYPFPLAYSALFAGLALKAPRHWGLILALPAFAVCAVDIIENTVQLFALKGFEDYLFTKEILTPLKFFLFRLAALIALISLVTWSIIKVWHFVSTQGSKA